MTYMLYSSRMSGKKNTTANARKPLNCETHFWMHLFSFSHTHAQALHGAQSWGACAGGGGWVMLRGRCPAASTFPPGRAECLSLSCLELHHLWKRQNKTNTTKQREVEVLRLSHLHALMRWKKGGPEQSLFNSLFLPPSIPQQAAVRWKPSIRITTMIHPTHVFISLDVTLMVWLDGLLKLNLL